MAPSIKYSNKNNMEKKAIQELKGKESMHYLLCGFTSNGKTYFFFYPLSILLLFPSKKILL